MSDQYPIYHVPSEEEVRERMEGLEKSTLKALREAGAIPVGENDLGRFLFLWEVRLNEHIMYRVIAMSALDAEHRVFDALCSSYRVGMYKKEGSRWVTKPAHFYLVVEKRDE